MGINIGTNIQSLQARRQLTRTTANLDKVYERLSSGLRINKAADDAAGLAIADALKVDQRIASTAIRNANDGISAIAIADGALAEVGSILNRMAELSEQSANGVFSNNQRSALETEFQALGSEIERIAVTTEFNDIALISSENSLFLQVGFDSRSTSQISIDNTNATLSALGLIRNTGGRYSLLANTISDSQSASRLALDAVKQAVTSLAATRGLLGASESRLNSALSGLRISRLTFASAESQIRDNDVAEDAAELTRLGILQQSGASILSQANQQPSLALQLLGG